MLFPHSIFQSTRPVRGATDTPSARIPVSCHFNPRAPCGARPTYMVSLMLQHLFQSTRPVRGATSLHNPVTDTVKFQSTRPVRGATSFHALFRTPSDISIHAPRAGRDFMQSTQGCRQLYFNPRAPCGARQKCLLLRLLPMVFQSTRPVRGATAKNDTLRAHKKISIHAPRAGRDS